MPGVCAAQAKKPDARAILRTSPAEMASAGGAEAVDPNAMFKFSYGLFVLTAKDGAKDNGCIINTASQLTDTPKRITIAVNKANYTHDMILKTGVFNVSVLSEDVGMDTFKRFGFQSGRSADKFDGCEGLQRSVNGLYYLTGCTNAVLSGKVIQSIDCGTHTLFIADVTEAKVLSKEPSVTYAYYFANIKPKPLPAAMTEGPKKGWICKICGFIYEGDPLPADYICPICKHGAADFERLG